MFPALQNVYDETSTCEFLLLFAWVLPRLGLRVRQNKAAADPPLFFFGTLCKKIYCLRLPFARALLWGPQDLRVLFFFADDS